MKYYIGIDLGGTNVRVARVDEAGNVIKDIIKGSRAKEGPDVIYENIVEILREFDMSDIEGIGLAIPGPCDPVTNTVTMATNFPGCEGYPFADKISKEFNKPVILDNDANVAGLAEAIFGAGKGYKTVFYLTHSTGIGGGLIINQKIMGGHKGYGGEIANVIVDPNAKQYPIYAHLNRGGVETVASGTAIMLKGQELIGPEIKNGADVFNLAKQGNPVALEIINKMSKDFAVCLGIISAVVAPDCFVIGGGCSQSADLYFDKIRQYFKEYAHEGMKDVPILKAELKEPGVLGAAMLNKLQ